MPLVKCTHKHSRSYVNNNRYSLLIMPSEVHKSSKVTEARPARPATKMSKSKESSKYASTGNSSSRKRRATDRTNDASKYRYVAVDCEFVGVGMQKLSALGRCSVVDYWGKVILDIYSIPDEQITDFRTPWSGIRPHHMTHAIPFDSARNATKAILKDKIVVGHAVFNDLKVLGLEQFVPRDMIRDTSMYEPLKRMAKATDRRTVSLKLLSQVILGRKIQNGEHCSVEDARATMDLFKKVEKRWEAELDSAPGSTAVKRPRNSSESKSYLDDDFWPDDSDADEE